LDRKQCQCGRNGIRFAKLPGYLRHSGIGKGHQLGTHTAAGLSQEGPDGLRRWGITDRNRIERGTHMIANAVNSSHEFIACLAVELASIGGRNQPCGLTPGTDISNSFEQFVIGDRRLAVKDRVGQVEYDMAADKVTGLPRRDNFFEIHGNQQESMTQ
jgi:hypothetical protein